jgi:hypothetical protein
MRGKKRPLAEEIFLEVYHVLGTDDARDTAMNKKHELYNLSWSIFLWEKTDYKGISKMI